MTISKSVLGSVAAVSLTVISAFATVPAQTSSCSYQFNTNLRLGAVSTDVQNLQKLLNMDAATKVASTGAGSTGYETLRFGPATLAAVKKFQAANGITPVSGYVGPLTRATLNTICSSSAPITSTPSTGTGVISNNIPVSVLVEKQASAKLGEFVVSGNGLVTVLELQRIGLSNNATLKSVYLYDGATRLTSGSSVLTDGTIRFSSGAGLFPVSGSKTITVRADINTSSSGQTVGVAMKSVTLAGSTATPVLGVNGPLFSISSATVIGANFSTASGVTPATGSLNSGSLNQVLWGNTLNISTNPGLLKGMTFKMIGSAPANTLSNVQLYVDGVSKGSATINSSNQFIFNLAGSPVSLTTGSHTVELRGDVVGGALRNFYISVEEATDVLVEDTTLPGVFVSVTNPTSVSTLTNLNGGTISINQGSLTINSDPAFNNTTTLVGGATNVQMASFKFTAYGEDVKVTSLTFDPTLTGAATAVMNVGLYVNGGQIGSNATNPVTGSNITFANLGTNLYIPAGQTVTVAIKGDAVDASNVALTGGTVKFDIASAQTSGNAQGLTSNQTFTTNTSTVGGQQLTVASSNVTFANAVGFAASSKAPNAQGVKIGSFTLQTGSAEGVQVTNVAVGLSGTLLSGNQISNITVKDGSTTIGTPIGNPTATNNFSANISVPVSSSKTFDVYADLGSGANGMSVTPTMLVTYRGATSNLTSYTNGNVALAGVTTSAAVAQMIATGVTFNTGLSPVAQYAVGGQSAFNIGTFNFKANTSVAGAQIRDVTFTTPNQNVVGSVTMNGKSGSFVAGTAVIYNVNLSVPADASGINIPVTVALGNVGTANGYAVNSGVVGANAQVTITGVTYYDGTQIQSISPTVNNATNVFPVVTSKPTLAVDSTQKTGLVVNAENKVGEVTITADAGGQIKLTTLTFNVVSTNLGSPTYTYRIADGNTTIAGTSCDTSAVCTMGSYTIAAGTSKTFSLYGTMSSGAPVASTVPSVSSSVTSAGFVWDDVQGGGTGLTGASIYNFPTASYSIRQ